MARCRPLTSTNASACRVTDAEVHKPSQEDPSEEKVSILSDRIDYSVWSKSSSSKFSDHPPCRKKINALEIVFVPSSEEFI